MAAPAPAPRKRTAAKKTAPAKKAPAQKTTPAAAGAAGSAPAAPPPGAVADGLSVNQWLHDLKSTPLRVQVFDRWWEFKQPTGGRAVTWDTTLQTKGIRAALAGMFLDETPAPERSVPGPDGTLLVLEALPGSAKADEFIAVANEWVPPGAAEEFWRRIERAIFEGEASAS